MEFLQSAVIFLSLAVSHQLRPTQFGDISEEACLTTLTQSSCASGEVLVEKIGLGGVCPGCKGGLGYNVQCRDNPIPCAPGLNCMASRCGYDMSTCWHTFHLNVRITVRPICNPDGSYAAIQCKGDQITGRCFCNNEDGERIFGWDWWRNSAQMTCACSRWRHKLEKKGVSGAFLRCSQNGNYEELQCTTKVCWCADPMTGQLQNQTRMVPREWWFTLECCK